jgi:sialate O-acetylesterase
MYEDFYADYEAIDNWDMLRFYNFPYGEASTPQVNYSRMMPWQSPEHAKQAASLSGMALAYGVHLQKMLGEDVPVGVVISAVGGACIEEWLDEATMADLPSHAASMDKKDCRFYNAMIHPIEGYTIRGILWNQGEANALWPEDYQQQFAAYAALYREKFRNPQLPILVTQLPQYDDDLYPVFRGAQWELMEQVDHVYTICGIDLGDPDNVHPTDKFAFSERAAGTALAMVYGLPAVEGMDWGLAPEIVKLERTEGGILLTVSNAQTLTGPEEIEGFMVMANQRWAYVPAELRGNQIFVQCDAANAAYINFLQDTSFPEMEFVRNEYGLPLAPMTYTAIPE